MAHAITITQLAAKRNRRFDADEIPFRVFCQPNLDQIRNIGDYINLIDTILNQIMTAIRGISNSDQDMVSVVVRPSSFLIPIITTWVRLHDYDNDLVYGEIEKVYQSNKKFIFDEEFYVWGRIVRQPRGGSRSCNIQDVNGARLKLKSIKQINIQNGWCMPAAVWLAKQHVDCHPNYRKYRETTTPIFLRIIKNYTAEVLGADRDLSLQNGATFEDLQKFQDSLGNQFQIKVFAFANPKREFLWASTLNGNDPQVDKTQLKRINLMYDQNHFDVITKLGGFFSASGYCHECNKSYHDVRTHRCVEKCGGCWRMNCAIPIPNAHSILCDDCHRSFRHQECFDHHKLQDLKRKKSLCERAYYCKNCCRLIFQRGKKVVKHLCGEIHCKNCKSFVPRDHQCYMSVFKSVEKEESDDDTNVDDYGDIGEEIARDDERIAGEVPAPSDSEISEYKKAIYVYYDCEAYLSDDNEHICNLVVAQWGTNEKVFKGDIARDEFCKWALSKAHSNWTFVAHNAKRYDDYFVMNYLVTHMPCLPTIITSGGSTLLIKLNAYNIRFIDSCCFMPSALAKLPSMFGIQDTVKKGFFPHTFNRPANYDYEGLMPDKNFYDLEGMNPDRRAEFDQWYHEKVANNYMFRFWDELIDYCRDDTRVLRLCSSLFRDQYFQMTNIDPFTKVTLASACNAAYRKNFLPANTISIIPASGYFGHDKQSRIALFWLEWLAYSTDLEIRHAHNGGEVEAVVNGGRKLKLDGMAELPNNQGVLALEFYGCYMHGCKECYASKTFNTLRQSTMENLYRTTIDREKALRDAGWTVQSIWECQFQNEKGNNPELARFLEEYDLEPPLQPRDAFYGGRTETIKLHHQVTGTEHLSYVDINSLYPWVQKTQKFPVGHPTILRGDEIDLHNISNYFGLIKCSIIPPQNLYHPVLPCHIDKKLKFVLCATCAKENSAYRCQHSDAERALKGTWVSVEIDVALKLGYRLAKVYEVWDFTDSSTDLFAGYVKLFTKEKLQAKGYPSWAQSHDDRLQFMGDIHRFEGIDLDPSKMESNLGRLVVAKLCLNTLWGKFGQRDNLAQLKFIRNPTELWEMLTNEQFSVKDVIFPSEQLAQVSFVEKDQFVVAGVNTNVVIAAFTTSYARLKLYQSVLPLDKQVCYMDTDSIVFIDPDPEELDSYRPPVGEHLGVYKDEIGIEDSMIEFTSGGPKNYGYRTASGKTCLKVKGITLNYRAQQVLDFPTIRNLITQRNYDRRIEVPMGFTVRREKDGWKLYTKENTKKYRFHFDKRIILPLPENRTIPFGYIHSDNLPDFFPEFPLNQDREVELDDGYSDMSDIGSYINDSFVDSELSENESHDSFNEVVLFD